MRRRFFLLTAATTLLVVLAFLVPLALLLQILAADRAVAEGQQDAQNLAVLVAVADNDQLAAAVTLLNQRSRREIGLVLPGGVTFGPPDRGSATSLRLAEAGRSFTARVHDGRVVYVPVDTEKGRAVVRCYVPESLLHRGLGPSIALLVGLAGVLFVLAVTVADRLAAGTVRPLRRLADTATALAEGDLTARADVAGPDEVQELAATVNMLASRIGELLSAEREAVADLSHRLRTPLTALRLDAERLAMTASARRLLEHITALERAVTELIDEARRPVREGIHPQCDAVAVVASRCSYWRVLFDAQDREFTSELRLDHGYVRTTAVDLGAALDALLQNVLRHTPPGTAARLRVEQLQPGTVAVTVEDDGPGYPPEAQVRGWSASGSSGLGVDIARRTAESSGGRLEIGSSDTGGARTRLVLGTSTTSPPGDSAP